MSYYYNYYLAFKDKDSGLIKPFAPYTIEGKLKPILEKSRSFASNLHQDFYIMSEKDISDEIRKEFEYEDWQGEKVMPQIKYLPYEELPETNYIKKGYFLIEDIKSWEEEGDDTLFYHMITPEAYARKLEHELVFGRNKSIKDYEGYEYIEANASDYSWYCAIDYNSKEFESWLIHLAVDMLYDYEFFDSNKEIIIIETEG